MLYTTTVDTVDNVWTIYNMYLFRGISDSIHRHNSDDILKNGSTSHTTIVNQNDCLGNLIVTAVITEIV